MKYICEIEYTNKNKETVFLKAKNDMHLEYKMVEHLNEIYGSIDCVEKITYCPFKRWMFKEMFHFFGGTISNRLAMQKTHDNWLNKKGE